jgi:uncharacterized protein (DUF58 family)
MFAWLRRLRAPEPSADDGGIAPLSPEELRELRRLNVVVGRKVDSLFSGDWRSAVRGRGMEFEEVRAYQPGDDVRRIDWNVTARTGEPFVKVFREERQAIVLLVIDVSGSTRAGTGGRDGRTNRRLQLARVAGGLALAGIRNQDRIGLVTFTDRVERYLSPRRSRGHSWAIIQAVYAGRVHGRGTDLAAVLQFVHQVQRRRAMIVLASDFLDDGPWQEPLGSLARRHKVHAIAVHDPLDLPQPSLGLLDVVDPETGARRVVDAAAWRGRVSSEERVNMLRRLGVRATALSTDEDAFAVLHRHFAAEGARR